VLLVRKFRGEGHSNVIILKHVGHVGWIDLHIHVALFVLYAIIFLVRMIVLQLQELGEVIVSLYIFY
jgi:hypothetical protein